jgi:PAS domain S-box-containing protein
VATTVDDTAPAERAIAAQSPSDDRLAKAFWAGLAPVSVSTLAEGRFIEVNNSFLEMLGYQRQEVIGHTARELRFWYNADDRGELLKRLAQHDGRLRYAEFPLRVKSGEVLHADISVSEIELDGERCLVAVYRDVTAQKRSRTGQLLAHIRRQLESSSREIRSVEEAIAQPPEDAAPAHTSAALGATIRVLAGCMQQLSDLHEAITGEDPSDMVLRILRVGGQSELLAAVQDAVATIERTKGSFKSKELAKLRSRLEQVLKN